MALRDASDIKYECKEDGINEIIDELSPTSYLALREVRWSENSDFKLDLRRYFVKSDNTEMPGKGTSICNPDRLADILVDENFGSTEKIFRGIMNRSDCLEGVGCVLADMDDGEYKTFKKDLDNARDSAIKERGMTTDDFLGVLSA